MFSFSLTDSWSMTFDPSRVNAVDWFWFHNRVSPHLAWVQLSGCFFSSFLSALSVTEVNRVCKTVQLWSAALYGNLWNRYIITYIQWQSSFSVGHENNSDFMIEQAAYQTLVLSVGIIGEVSALSAAIFGHIVIWACADCKTVLLINVPYWLSQIINKYCCHPRKCECLRCVLLYKQQSGGSSRIWKG